MTQSKSFAQKRRQSRLSAMQALYQWEMTKHDRSFLEKQFEEDEYFKEILYGVMDAQETIDGYIKRYIDRPFEELDPVELSIARVATFELLKKIDVPYKVVLNEALELAKKYGAQEGHKFVNGVLDKIAREIRHHEASSNE